MWFLAGAAWQAIEGIFEAEREAKSSKHSVGAGGPARSAGKPAHAHGSATPGASEWYGAGVFFVKLLSYLI